MVGSANGAHFLRTSLFKEPMAPDDPFAPCELDDDDERMAPKDAYMSCPSRGDWWNDENAWGDAGPVGKKLEAGDVGGEL